MRVTVGIKALNEEARIAACLDSVMAAVAGMEAQVILADSGSTDATVAIARRYPVRIVRLADKEARSCGAGAQLAFQYADGDYFYMLDGDMTLHPDMLARGIAFLDAHPEAAGVAGVIVERNLDAAEFRVRADRNHTGERWVDRLDCGGLYRMAALRRVGYFADRNLHAFEEYDLGARLAADGWRLARIGAPGIDHYGHRMGGYRLLFRRLRSGYSDGLGELLRAALGRAHLGVLIRRHRTMQMAFVVIGWWAVLAMLLATGRWAAAALLAVVPLLLLMARRRSASLGAYSFVTCNVLAIGLVRGLFRRRIPPTRMLAASDVAAR